MSEDRPIDEVLREAWDDMVEGNPSRIEVTADGNDVVFKIVHPGVGSSSIRLDSKSAYDLANAVPFIVGGLMPSCAFEE